MSKPLDTKPRAQRIDSQDEAVASSVEATEQREATAQEQAPIAGSGESPAPKPRTTRNRLLTITQRFATFRTRLPIWSLLVLALLFAGPVAAFEPAFGGGAGAIAAGAGVACGLLIAAASTRWRWDALTTVLSVVVTYFLLGSAAALRAEALYGFLPTGKTLQVMVLGSFRAWKDLLTLTPPVSVYSGPALVPWMCGLVCAVLAGLITARSGRAVLGSIPLVVMGVISIFFGLSRHALPVWAVLAWWALLAAWWALAAQSQRIRTSSWAALPLAAAKRRPPVSLVRPCTLARACWVPSPSSRCPSVSRCPPLHSSARAGLASWAATWWIRPSTFRPTPRPCPPSATTRRTCRTKLS